MRALAYFSVLACVVLTLVGTTARGDVIYKFSTLNATLIPDDGYDPAVVTILADANVTGPANGTALAAGDTGLARFWNTEWAGFSLSSSNGTAIDNATEFATGYWELTVTANPTYALNLSSLQFRAAQGGTSGTRRYEIYAAVDGGPITFGDTPIYTPPGTGTETGTRSNPRPVTVDLSGTTYQGVNSITLRYYPLTPAYGNTIDFDGWTLNGTVQAVPEPSGLLLGGIGLLGLAFAVTCRRRCGGVHA